MRDGVTLYRRILLAGHKLRISPEYIIYPSALNELGVLSPEWFNVTFMITAKIAVD